MNICLMCGTPYTPGQEDAYYITEEKEICSKCSDALEILMTSENPKEIHSAFAYLHNCLGITTDSDVKNHLMDILENNANLAEEMEWEKYQQARSEYRNTPEEAYREQNSNIFQDTFSFSTASGDDLPYVVLQVTLKEKLLGTGSRNLKELEEAINFYAYKGYRLHTMATSHTDSKGGFGGDRIQATLVFEKKEF